MALSIAGDASTIRSSATRWSAFAESTSLASGDIRRIDSGDFRGDEADLYRDRLNADLPPHLDTASQAWATVSSALHTYAAALESLQQRMIALSTTAVDQQTQASAAHDAVADAHTADTRHTAAVEAEQRALPTGQTLPADTYESQAGAASGRLDAANAALQATTDAANQVHADHNAALDVCVRAIDTAAGLRFEEPPGFWGRLSAAVGGWVRDHADVLKAISGVLKQISSIVGLLAMIPVLAPVMGPIAAAAGAGSAVIDGAVVLATGEGSMTDVLIDAAGMLPGGRAAGSVVKGAKAAREALAAKAAVGATRTLTTVGKDARGMESVGRQAGGVDKALAGADGAGGRAVNHAESAVAHDTPVEKLPCVGDPIDVVTGEMVLAHTDVALPGVLPLILRRVYKSGYRWGGAFGNSWASTLDQRVEIGSDGAACFVAEDGVVLHYLGVDSAAQGPWLPTEGVQRWPLQRYEGGGWAVEDPDRRVTRVFAAADADGCCPLLEIRDSHDNVIQFAYGDRGVVSEVRHSAGYVVRVDSTRRLVTGLSVGDELVASFEYDALGQLVRDNNAAGVPLTLQWYSGRIVGWCDRNDVWYRYEYDESGRCVRTAGRGRVLSYGFSYLPGRTLVTDSLGAVTTYEHNAAHQVTRTVNPLGNATTSAWDRHDRLLLRTDPLGRCTQLEYDAGRLVVVIHSDGSRQALRRNECGDVVEAIDASGAVWSQEWDDDGNVISSRDPLGAVTTFTYSAHGAVETMTDPLGATSMVQSNAAGLPVAVSDPLGATSRIEYDGRGRVVRSIDALGGITSFGWTVDGKPAYRVGPDGAREEWKWDQEGNLTSFVDAAGARTTIENGVFDLPVARTVPDSGRMTFGYDTELRLTVVQNPAGRRWQYEYDAAGRLVTETDFNNRMQHYRYDAAGQLIAVVNGLGQETRLGYDAAGNVVEQATADGVTRMTYDLSARLLTAESPGAVVTFDRDAAGRIVRETVNGRSVTVAVDAAGRRVSRTTPSGVRSEWQFDGAGRPASLTTAGERVSFEHDALGREVSRRFGAGGRLEQHFDAAHRLLGQQMKVAIEPSPAAGVVGRDFDYRVDGVLAGVVDTFAETSRQFDLDAAGRVIGVRAARWAEGYSYDLAGRVIRDSSGSGLPGEPFGGHRAYEGSLVTRAGAVSYGYDRQGRVVTRSRKRLSQSPEVWQFRYDAGDRMVAAISAGQQWTYTYDAFGRRISKQRLGADDAVVEQTVFSWDGNLLIEQAHTVQPGSAPMVTTWDYLPGSWTPVSQTVGGGDVDAEFYAIVSDLVGTPTELVTPDGRRVVWTGAAATVWGAPRHKAANRSTKFGAPGVDCPIRFPGQYADDETGLHYNRYRYYDPVAGRYTTADPLGLAPADDPYGYVLNPTGWADPLGLTPCGPRQEPSDHILSDLSAFGNKSKPRDPRLGKDFEVDAEGMVIPQQPPHHLGVSTTSDPLSTTLKGPYHTVPKGTPMPPGFAVIRDGREFEGGTHAVGHSSFFATERMTVQVYIDRFQSMPWSLGGVK